MGYIIENANILKDTQLTKCSLMIKDNAIASRDICSRRLQVMKMNAENYIMTPAFVQFDSKIPLQKSFHELKSYIINQFLLKGSTTLLYYAEVTVESELNKKIKEIKTALISSPIDFVIGVKITPQLLTPSFIRKCKKEKTPAIFVTISDVRELDSVPWGWIKEALFPYNCPLIPTISNDNKKEEKKSLSKWKEVMEKEKIPALLEEIPEGQPLSSTVLNKLGIYPDKSSLLHGTELSYNLFNKSREINIVDEVSLFHYHCDRLIVTVHKGKVIRAGEKVIYKPGYGEYVRVRTPSYFSL